ncbi:MAG: helix-turn-helix domain-containing protein [Ancalomicrobiaceae bacterium]|nr:helix-turn-helix domain-containing protein [Ancalomicrobiaceae bacterium]
MNIPQSAFEVARLAPEPTQAPFPDLVAFKTAERDLAPPVALTRKLGPRVAIYRAGDAAEFTYEMIDGGAILWTMLPDGRRQIVQMIRPGDAFGFAALDQHDATAVTTVTSRIRVVPLAQSTRSLMSQGALLRQALARIRALQAHALLLGRMTALERVAHFLLTAFCASPGSDGSAHDGGDHIRLFVTREEIGDYLGLTIETVSRNLGKLRRSGIIALDHADRIRLIDHSALAAIAGPVGEPS